MSRANHVSRLFVRASIRYRQINLVSVIPMFFFNDVFAYACAAILRSVRFPCCPSIDVHICESWRVQPNALPVFLFAFFSFYTTDRLCLCSHLFYSVLRQRAHPDGPGLIAYPRPSSLCKSFGQAERAVSASGLQRLLITLHHMLH